MGMEEGQTGRQIMTLVPAQTTSKSMRDLKLFDGLEKPSIIKCASFIFKITCIAASSTWMVVPYYLVDSSYQSL